MTTFSDLGLPAAFTDRLAGDGITTPFPIQSAAIPDALAGRDVCGRAPTGSGKTFAFGLPLLATLDRATSRRPRGLVLVPTRELADQIRDELEPFARMLRRSITVVYGGVGYGPQRNALRKGSDLVIATPGRLEDLLSSGDISLDAVDVVALDEADRMADMGFLPAVRRILDLTPSNRQTLLFSATLDGDVAILTRQYQRDARRHEAVADESNVSAVDHHFWKVERHDRLDRTAAIAADSASTIVFTRTRHGADRLVKQLVRHDITAAALHGGKSQPQRTKALAAFSKGRVTVLVATDVAARGIHVDDVATVIHFDPPEDAKTYVHRSGRTARAGAGGAVHSLIEGGQVRDARRMIRDLALDVDVITPDRSTTQGTASTNGTPTPRTAPMPEATPATRPTERPRGSDTRPDVEGNVYVANLPYSMTSGDLTRLFERFGAVDDATIVTHRNTTKSRGFGFVAMNDPVAAIQALNGTEVEGRQLTVREARPRVAAAS